MSRIGQILLIFLLIIAAVVGCALVYIGLRHYLRKQSVQTEMRLPTTDNASQVLQAAQCPASAPEHSSTWPPSHTEGTKEKLPPTYEEAVSGKC